MKFVACIILLAAVVVPTVSAQTRPKAAENPNAVVPAPRRSELLKKAEARLTLHPVGGVKSFAETADPFFRSNLSTPDRVEPEPNVRTVEQAGMEELRRIAEEIKPQGVMLIAGEQYLLLNGGRRVKSGDTIPVTLEGLVYQVVISSIEAKSYTLRLNDQELKREFK